MALSFRPSFHPSWPEASKSLVLRAIDRHGGWSLWSRFESVSADLVELTGFIPRIKGYRRSFDLPRTLTAYPRLGRVDFREGLRRHARFEQGAVKIYDRESGEVVSESLDHRATFAGAQRKRAWSEVDAIYFFGYAFACYTSLPFILPSLPFLGDVRGRWRGERLTGVTVDFPPEAHVHCQEQSFFFDGEGLLRRMDYVADVIGSWTTGAHGCDDHVIEEGLPFPLRRTVVWRLGGLPVGAAVALAARFDAVSVKIVP